MASASQTHLVNEIDIHIGTPNGSGSQSSNTLLLKTLFRMGLPVSGKNFFPSNIAGLPTWFNIRVSQNHWLTQSPQPDILIAMNKDSWVQDLKKVKTGGVVIFNEDLKLSTSEIRSDVQFYGLPCRQLLKEVTDSAKLKKLLTNMLYVGALAQFLKLPLEIIQQVLQDQLANKKPLLKANLDAIDAGYKHFESIGVLQSEYKITPILEGSKNKVLMDGNTASALGALHGGCQFVSWYPITPSSSIAETFQKYCEQYRIQEDGKKNYAILQAEDELSAISMVIGAGWNGARAMTTTSGPGLSLMAEAAGLSYFAEVPAVIWDVQRAGPSTGLPTRTMQGDISAAAHLSHGDTEHILLLPATLQECFDFGQTCFDLAERFQTLVIVLSDLDLGMNLWTSDNLKISQTEYDRGKLAQKDFAPPFQRYADLDNDGVPTRSLPGNGIPDTAYFTRGSGHDPSALYTESADNHKDTLDRLKRKMETARKYVPKPTIVESKNKSIGLIAYGSSDLAMTEFMQRENCESSQFGYLRLRALPFTDEVENFIENYKHIIVIEQNREGQMFKLLKSFTQSDSRKLSSVTHYDGHPLTYSILKQKIERTQKAFRERL